MKLNLIYSFLLSLAFFAFSQQIDENASLIKIAQLETQLQKLDVEKKALIFQSDSLAGQIQRLKTKGPLNIFERQRLESLLKFSQLISQQIHQQETRQFSMETEYQQLLIRVVSFYEGKIQVLLKQRPAQKVTAEKFEMPLQQLRELKAKRDQVQKKVTPVTIQLQSGATFKINESDSYLKIRHKADFIKDQEEKTEKQMAQLRKKREDLQNALKLRTRMNEFISDSYLFDRRSEVGPSLSDQKNLFDAEGGAEFYRSVSTEPSQLIEIIDHFLIETDLASVSNVDLEFYLQNLTKLEAKLKKSADSLHTKASQFYEAAEKRRKEVKP